MIIRRTGSCSHFFPSFTSKNCGLVYRILALSIPSILNPPGIPSEELRVQTACSKLVEIEEGDSNPVAEESGVKIGVSIWTEAVSSSSPVAFVWKEDWLRKISARAAGEGTKTGAVAQRIVFVVRSGIAADFNCKRFWLECSAEM